MGSELNDDEDMLVATVRAFTDPEAWIDQMQRIGICRSWRAAG